MNPDDPTVQRVELDAAALGELRDRLVLFGGCTAKRQVEFESRELAGLTVEKLIAWGLVACAKPMDADEFHEISGARTTGEKRLL